MKKTINQCAEALSQILCGLGLIAFVIYLGDEQPAILGLLFLSLAVYFNTRD